MSTYAPVTSTAIQIRKIISGFKNCLKSWGEVRVLARAQPSMNTVVFCETSDSLESTLQSGEKTVTGLMTVSPEHQGAFNFGDDKSRLALNVVIEHQKTLVEHLEDIKRQLTHSYHEQFSTKEHQSQPTDSVLDIYTIMSLRESSQDQINATSKALKDLARRTGPTEGPMTPPSYQDQPSFQAPPPRTPQARGATNPGHDSSRPEIPPRQRPAQSGTPQSTPSVSRPPKRSPAPPSSLLCTQPRDYCTGSLRLQLDRKLTIQDILSDDGCVCKYCNLELGLGRGDTEAARQHVLACASLMERKAMFRCLVCSKQNRDAEFRRVKEFLGHLEGH